MPARPLRIFVSCGLIVLATTAGSLAQSPPTWPYCCEAHARQAGVYRGPGSSRGLFGTVPGGRAGSTSGRGDAYGRPALPRGQVYYGGRYFGSFNNRFYGPQYGNF
jgi:hypothetical protein